MTDTELLTLFIRQDERAVTETQNKYGRICRNIAFGLLGSREDAEEIFNDVLMRAWKILPKEQPKKLLSFLAVMTRNLATNRLDQYTAQRRGGSAQNAVLEELAECVAAPGSVEQTVDAKLLDDALVRFLDALPQEQRSIFVLRYYYSLPLQDIAEQRQISLSKVKVTLMRLRKKLNQYLTEEGFL